MGRNADLAIPDLQFPLLRAHMLVATVVVVVGGLAAEHPGIELFGGTLFKRSKIEGEGLVVVRVFVHYGTDITTALGIGGQNDIEHIGLLAVMLQGLAVQLYWYYVGQQIVGVHQQRVEGGSAG